MTQILTALLLAFHLFLLPASAVSQDSQGAVTLVTALESTLRALKIEGFVSVVPEVSSQDQLILPGVGGVDGTASEEVYSVRVFTVTELSSDQKKFVESAARDIRKVRRLSWVPIATTLISKPVSSTESEAQRSPSSDGLNLTPVVEAIRQGSLVASLVIVVAAMLVVVGLLVLPRRLRAHNIDGERKDIGPRDEEGLARGDFDLPPVAPMRRSVDVSEEVTTALDNIRRWSPESVLELFADLYWSEKDGDLKFLWSHTEPLQRTHCLTIFPQLENALKGSAQAEWRLPKTILEDPAYVVPMGLFAVSNTDLTSLVIQSEGMFNKLSLLRQDRIEATLEKKMSWQKVKTDDSIKPHSLPVSAPRSLSPGLRVLELSIEDEKRLADNPMIVSKETALGIPTWAWFVALPDEFRLSLLASVSAQDLADIWVGAPSILEIVLKSMPEKKRALVTGYINQRTPRRDHPLLREISRRAIEELWSMQKMHGGEPRESDSQSDAA